jgi:hypothetical protein
MPRAKTAEEVIDAYLDTASRESLLRLYSDVRAALRWKHGMFKDPGDGATPPKRAYVRKAKAEQPSLLESK